MYKCLIWIFCAKMQNRVLPFCQEMFLDIGCNINMFDMAIFPKYSKMCCLGQYIPPITICTVFNATEPLDEIFLISQLKVTGLYFQEDVSPNCFSRRHMCTWLCFGSLLMYFLQMTFPIPFLLLNVAVQLRNKQKSVHKNH